MTAVMHIIIAYISVMHYINVNVGYRGIITKVASRPSATIITRASITEAIINTPIKTYVGAPIAYMKPINSCF
jgi:hypothetical protein